MSVKSIFGMAILAMIVSMVMLTRPAASQNFTMTPTATPAKMQSLFSFDTCSPPCWFGLTPGISTSQEAFEFLTSYEYVTIPTESAVDFASGEIDLETGHLINGRYNFTFGPAEMPQSHGIFSAIFIKNGIVDKISIVMREHVTIQEALDLLGQPDQIHFEKIISFFGIDFIYLKTLLRVDFISVDERDLGVICNLSQMEDQFWVIDIIYFSPRASLEMDVVNTDPADGLQSSLTAYHEVARYIPPETWDFWFSGQVDKKCRQGWKDLPEDRVLLDLTAIPTLEPTLVP